MRTATFPADCLLKIREKELQRKDQQAIFDPFSQLQETSDGSTGLGLSICQRLCDLMGGENRS